MAVGRKEVRISAQQEPDAVDVAFRRDVVQRRRHLSVGDVDLGAVVQQRRHDLQVAVPSG